LCLVLTPTISPEGLLRLGSTLEICWFLAKEVSAIGAIMIGIETRFDTEGNPSKREEQTAYYESTTPGKTSRLSSHVGLNSNDLTEGTIDIDGIFVMLNIAGVIHNISGSFSSDTHNDYHIFT